MSLFGISKCISEFCSSFWWTSGPLFIIALWSNMFRFIKLVKNSVMDIQVFHSVKKTQWLPLCSNMRLQDGTDESSWGFLVWDLRMNTSMLSLRKMLEWLRLCAPSAGGPGSIPGQRTRSHMHATTKTQRNKINKIIFI